MRVCFRGEQRQLNRLYEIAFRGDVPPAALSLPQGSADPILVNAQADVDISDSAFDFVRSIRVFEITYQQQHSPHDGCTTSSMVYEGSYGEQGDYTRRRSSISVVPAASDLKTPENCNNYSHRSVFVEWRDFEGSYGHEEVHY